MLDQYAAFKIAEFERNRPEIVADKYFEFLAIPGLGHSDGGAYGRKKRKDFFVKKLHGIDPPDRNRVNAIR